MESIVDILSQGRDREAQASKIHGFVIGLVTNNQDPDDLGRVKVKFPWLSDDVESWWARVVQPMAGPERGFFFIPEVDDEVLVGFEQGDVRFPYVLGSLYNGQDKPGPKGKSNVAGDFAGSSKKNDLRTIVSRSGHTIALDDKEGEEMIAIANNTGENWIEIHTKDNLIFINSKKDIHIKAENDITIEAGNDIITKSGNNTDMHADADFLTDAGANMKNTAAQNVTIEGGQNVSAEAKGGDFKIKAAMGVTIDGMTVSAKASTDLKAEGLNSTLSGSAMTTIKGGLVKIN